MTHGKNLLILSQLFIDPSRLLGTRLSVPTVPILWGGSTYGNRVLPGSQIDGWWSTFNLNLSAHVADQSGFGTDSWRTVFDPCKTVAYFSSPSFQISTLGTATCVRESKRVADKARDSVNVPLDLNGARLQAWVKQVMCKHCLHWYALVCWLFSCEHERNQTKATLVGLQKY